MNLQQYLMSLLMEEASEVAQAANKCNRFTPDHIYADYGNSNLERLQIEITDLVTVLSLLEKELGVTFDMTPSNDKVQRITNMMVHSRAMGTLTDA